MKELKILCEIINDIHERRNICLDNIERERMFKNFGWRTQVRYMEEVIKMLDKMERKYDREIRDRMIVILEDVAVTLKK